MIFSVFLVVGAFRGAGLLACDHDKSKPPGAEVWRQFIYVYVQVIYQTHQLMRKSRDSLWHPGSTRFAAFVMTD